MWGELVDGASPFMAHQAQEEGRFDFYGIDIIADTFGDVWLLECNRLPGLGVTCSYTTLQYYPFIFSIYLSIYLCIRDQQQ